MSTLKAQVREASAKGKQLRREGVIPGGAVDDHAVGFGGQAVLEVGQLLGDVLGVLARQARKHRAGRFALGPMAQKTRAADDLARACLALLRPAGAGQHERASDHDNSNG